MTRDATSASADPLRLENGSRVGVIGGGPAGSFASYFILQLARRTGLQLELDIFEPRDFGRRGPGSCNMCGGIVSESLLQNLAGEGIVLPRDIIQRRIDSYQLHMDVGDVRIATPAREKRIAAVHRGSGPRTFEPVNSNSFDAHLLSIARGEGANVIRERVGKVHWENERPAVQTKADGLRPYDLLVAAVGVNAAPKLFDIPELRYEPPRSARTGIAEFYLGRNIVKRYLGNAMHIFLLDLPRVTFAAIIPKSDYVTVCLLGDDLDQSALGSFLATREVKECMPPLWRPPTHHCHCAPRLNVGAAVHPFFDRLVFVGDCASTRLYKDGIGAAYRTAKSAAVTAVFHGVSARAFERHYRPACKAIDSDNRVGRLVFALTHRIQRSRVARQAVWKVVSQEQTASQGARRLSSALWDIFTGSASYRSALVRLLHPQLLARLTAALIASRSPQLQRRRKIKMATGITDAMGHRYEDGEVIYHQGDTGDAMYAIQSGKVEVIQRRGDKEFCLAELGGGDLFGEMALFGEGKRSATVRAVGAVWVYTLERDSLLRRIHEDPSMAFKLIQQLCYRIRDLETMLVREASVPL